MIRWLAAILLGCLVALLPLAAGAARRQWRRALLPALARAAALVLLVALVLDAPAGRARPPRPFAAIDASASGARGRATAPIDEGVRWATSAGAESVFTFGDSLRLAARGSSDAMAARDAASRVRPAVERALAAGRPLLVATDGEIDDPDALRLLPAGSEVRLSPAPAVRDAAVAALEAPRAAAGGDTIELQVTIAAGGAGSGEGAVELRLGDALAGRLALAPLEPWGTRALSLRTVAPRTAGPLVLRAVVRAAGDAEARNDTLAAALEVSEAASAVFVSTAPDYDARYVAALLRGTLSVPTRGFVRVAAGEWRREATLERATEAEVRAALRDAPLAVIHGDTGALGAPRALARGSLALLAPPTGAADDGGTGRDEFFATGAPSSPLQAALAALPWDSLPPLRVAEVAPRGEWEGLEARRARRGERRVAIAGSESPRRVVTVAASGFWQWRFRGGAPADAFAALWGSIFDWLAEERLDARAAVPAAGSVRAGEPVRWRRGTAARGDTVTVALVRRGGDGRATAVPLRFAEGANVAESPPLAPGVYDVNGAGGRSLLVVNPSREWVPRAPVAKAGRVGDAPPAGAAPPLRDKGWAYLLVALLLCVEWVVRRRLGMR